TPPTSHAAHFARPALSPGASHPCRARCPPLWSKKARPEHGWAPGSAETTTTRPCPDERPAAPPARAGTRRAPRRSPTAAPPLRAATSPEAAGRARRKAGAATTGDTPRSSRGRRIRPVRGREEDGRGASPSREAAPVPGGTRDRRPREPRGPGAPGRTGRRPGGPRAARGRRGTSREETLQLFFEIAAGAGGAGAEPGARAHRGLRRALRMR